MHAYLSCEFGGEKNQSWKLFTALGHEFFFWRMDIKILRHQSLKRSLKGLNISTATKYLKNK